MAQEKPKVLLVDDDHDMLEVLDTAMQTLGFQTVLARDGEEGWNKFVEHRPSLVISDIYMPKKNGVILLDQIKEMQYDTKVILITGYAHYKQLISHSRFPPDEFLSKPFNLRDLVEKIKDAHDEEA
ncbi:response regulator [bacterium]|nr:response regulator [bacterium]